MRRDADFEVIATPLKQNWWLFKVSGTVSVDEMRPPAPAIILLLLDFTEPDLRIGPATAVDLALDVVGRLAARCGRSDRIAVGLVGIRELVTAQIAPTAREWEQAGDRWIGPLNGDKAHFIDDARNRGSWLMPAVTVCKETFGNPSHCLVTGDGRWFDRNETAQALGQGRLIPIKVDAWPGRDAPQAVGIDEALSDLARPALSFGGGEPTAFCEADSFVAAAGMARRRILQPEFAGNAQWLIDLAYVGPMGCVPSWQGTEVAVTERTADDDERVAKLRDAALTYLRGTGDAVEWVWDLDMALKIATAEENGLGEVEINCPRCGRQTVRPESARCSNGDLPFCGLALKQQPRELRGARYIVLDMRSPATQEPQLLTPNSNSAELPGYGRVCFERGREGGWKVICDNGTRKDALRSTKLGEYLLLNVSS